MGVFSEHVVRLICRQAKLVRLQSSADVVRVILRIGANPRLAAQTAGLERKRFR